MSFRYHRYKNGRIIQSAPVARASLLGSSHVCRCAGRHCSLGVPVGYCIPIASVLRAATFSLIYCVLFFVPSFVP